MPSKLLHASAKILIVEDDAVSARILYKILQRYEYTIQQVVSGAEAIAAAKAAPPDSVLLDIQLPGIDGYEVCRQFKAEPDLCDIPVIFISSRNEVSDQIKGFEVGGVDYIAKPFQPAEVLARVRNQITSFQRRRQLSQQNALLLQEVRDRQKSEIALRETEAKYRSIFENVSEGIFQVTIAGRYLSANPALAKILGYDSSEELIETVLNIEHQLYARPKRRQELMAYLRQYGQITDAESEVYCKDGSKIWISENIRVATNTAGEVLFYEGTVQDVSDRHRMEAELRQQRQRSERLLVNILPYQIAHRLKTGSRNIAESFDQVTVLFADLVDFTAVATQISPQELVSLLNQIFSDFDALAEKYGLEKIKTIGDAYMAAAGLPIRRPDHADAVARMALSMQETIGQYEKPDGTPFQLRIGINTGAVVAGVIGIKKFSYDLWGDAVNMASRMEMLGEPGKIQVTEAAYERLKNRYLLEQRGSIEVKGRGKMTTYWLLGKKR
ncbi:MAG: response regulator [Leptolyngbyaceae cyanobacterium SL_1_1]|nr:response regulator [Leptolyngbyaceae cyanobacterium RM1_1_2]NJO09040.1 response regulator [Leptolyngbyaceae cyanobacterium SL_1_1]